LPLNKNKYTQPERRGVDIRQLKLQHICLQLAALGHHCQMDADRSYLSVADKTDTHLKNRKITFFIK